MAATWRFVFVGGTSVIDVEVQCHPASLMAYFMQYVPIIFSADTD